MIDRKKEIIFNIIDTVLQEDNNLTNFDLIGLRKLGYSSKDISFFYNDELKSILSHQLFKYSLPKKMNKLPFSSEERMVKIREHIEKM